METVLQPTHQSHITQGTQRTYSSVRRADRGSVDAPDFSLELSGGLESESTDDDNTLDNIISLDPEVLASLVIQLRTNLSSAVRERNDVRSERDHLIRDLAIVQTRLQELEGTQEREVEYLNEMAMWRKRCEEAEEQIGMLRGKVEESRRAVMTLQTQSRRISQLSTPYGTGSPHAQTFGQDSLPRTPGYQKRMSLQAVTGSGPPPPVMGAPPKGRPHQRRSSVSDPEPGTSSIGSLSSHAPSSFPETSSQEADSTGFSKPGSASRRHSAMIGRPTESLLNPMGAELESLRQELIAVRVELMETKQELWESNEAKEASDVCMKALKEFIAENSIGDSNKATTPLSLPPLPTDRVADSEEDGDWSKTPVVSHAPSASVSKKGWGIGFWSSPTAPSGPSPAVKSGSNDTAVSHSSASSAPLTKSPTILAPTTAISSFVSKWRTSTATTTTSPSTTSPSVPNKPSPITSSPSYSFASAFTWNSATPPPSQPSPNDNYTPAPTLGSIRRRPSAYSSPSFDVDYHSSSRKGSLAGLFEKSDTEPDAEDVGKRDTLIAPRGSMETMAEISLSPEHMHHSLPDSKPSPIEFHRPYLDSTPSLTDTETTNTTNPSSGSEQEPDSPFSKRGRLTPVKKSTGSGVVGGAQRRASPTTSRSSSRSAGDRDLLGHTTVPGVPPLPISASPRLSEFTKPRVPLSPVGSPKLTPGDLEGRKRARSRAASTVVNAGAAMETIDESAVEREKMISLSK